VGVIVICPTFCADVLLFAAVNDTLPLPLPLAARPIEELSFVQVKSPVAEIDVLVPTQTVWLPLVVTAGVGFTVTSKAVGAPLQVALALVYTGVTVIVPTFCVVELLFVPVKADILPVPLAASPIVVLLLAHVYDVPLPVKVTAVVVPPLHTIWLLTGFTKGVGFTVTVKLVDMPLQVIPPLV